MPIIFVHGVSSRKYNNHEKTWKEIEENLKELSSTLQEEVQQRILER